MYICVCVYVCVSMSLHVCVCVRAFVSHSNRGKLVNTRLNTVESGWGVGDSVTCHFFFFHARSEKADERGGGGAPTLFFYAILNLIFSNQKLRGGGGLQHFFSPILKKFGSIPQAWTRGTYHTSYMYITNLSDKQKKKPTPNPLKKQKQTNKRLSEPGGGGGGTTAYVRSRNKQYTCSCIEVLQKFDFS